ncbi:MAG: hypothetical protein V1759_00050 [bacterium]
MKPPIENRELERYILLKCCDGYLSGQNDYIREQIEEIEKEHPEFNQQTL